MKILIVGAGLAGAATAIFLARQGNDVEVIDASERPHEGGYVLQLDQTAQKTATDLGIGDLVAELSVATPRISLSAGRRRLLDLRLPGFRVARRGSFVTATMQRARLSAPVRLGIRLVTLEHHREGVTARFSNGTEERYDLVVGADGVSSTVRSHAFPDESPVHMNGYASVWIDIATAERQSTRAMVGCERSSVLQIFPYPGHSELVYAGFRAPRGSLDAEHGQRAVGSVLRHWGLHAEAEQALAADLDEVRVLSFAQVRTPSWHNRRVVLVGDAAHCIDPLSGLGSHGAFLGARNLASAIGSGAPLHQALGTYEKSTRPFVTMAQRITTGLLNTLTAAGAAQFARGLVDLVHASTSAVSVAVSAATTSAEDGRSAVWPRRVPGSWLSGLSTSAPR